MRLRTSFTSAALVISCLTASPKDKKKGVLPVDIVQAHTVWVMVDPNVVKRSLIRSTSCTEESGQASGIVFDRHFVL